MNRTGTGIEILEMMTVTGFEASHTVNAPAAIQRQHIPNIGASEKPNYS